EHHERLLNLLDVPKGADLDGIGDPVLIASRRLIAWNDPRVKKSRDRPADRAEADALAAVVREYCVEGVAEMEEYLAAEFPTPEQDIERLSRRATVDDSDEFRAILRYESMHAREFRSTLNQLVKLTQTGADLVEDAPEPAVESPQVVSVEIVEA